MLIHVDWNPCNGEWQDLPLTANSMTQSGSVQRCSRHLKR